MVYIISWFILGFVGGILCSLVDFFIKDLRKFSVRQSVIFSFIGPLLFIWFFYYLKEAKRDTNRH